MINRVIFFLFAGLILGLTSCGIYGSPDRPADFETYTYPPD